jgi:cytochrome b561
MVAQAMIHLYFYFLALAPNIFGIIIKTKSKCMGHKEIIMFRNNDFVMFNKHSIGYVLSNFEIVFL